MRDLMKAAMLLGALVVTAGCPGVGKDSDSAGGGDCNGAPTIDSYDYSCGGGSCTLSVTASAPMGGVTWTIIETGDPGYSCGPKGDLECGVWQEIHDDFSVAGANGACGEVKELTLEVVDNFQNQVDNESTLFDTEPVTILIEIEDTNGNVSDCEVDGDNPAHFASDCAN